MGLRKMTVNILLAIIMVICAAADIKKREIPIWIFIMLGGIALIDGIFCKEYGFYQIAAGVIPGLLLLGLAKITEQSIGYGDGIVLAEIGCMAGAGGSMVILSGALALAGIFSLGMLVIKKVDKRYRIPFVPFLTAAYLAVQCVQDRWI